MHALLGVPQGKSNSIARGTPMLANFSQLWKFHLVWPGPPHITVINHL